MLSKLGDSLSLALSQNVPNTQWKFGHKANSYCNTSHFMTPVSWQAEMKVVTVCSNLLLG